jgi:superfamily II DNA/RNA helicase
VQRLLPIVRGQGAQVVVFSFFTSVIPFVQQALEEARLTVAPYHGGMADKVREENKARWKQGHFEILLSSDAGARGINLPEAMYVFEYEMALTRANQIQRLNRIHRIDSKHPSVTFQSLVAYDTVEEGIAQGVMRRNDWMDKLLEDEDAGENFITAKQRKQLLKIGRSRAA